MPGDEASIGDQQTVEGGTQPSDSAKHSLGDELTFDGSVAGDDAPFDDGMEVIDLSARYTTEGVLGKGGMGEVLLATDTRLERKVAIKRMLGDGARSRAAVSRFLKEAKSIAALNHPNIVQVYDYGRAADGPFLIMEYVEGSSLLDKCREAVQVDDQISATVAIANRTDLIAPMVMLDLPIPGGFEIVSDDLDRLKQDGVIERYDRTQRQAILYLINLKPNQKLRIQYRLRATMPDRVAVPGAQVWEYYAPDRRARTTSTRFEVGDI